MTAPARSFEAIPGRAAPSSSAGVAAWLRGNLFSDWKNTAATLVMAALLVAWIPPLVDWAVFDAVFRPDNEACRATGHAAACWGVVAEKYRLIIFGRYPFDEQWRPLVATGLMIAVLVVSCYRPFWGRWLVPAWVVVLAAFLLLMRGGVFGLSLVDTDRWGGFPLTVMLSTMSLAMAFPLAILVALGRRSNMPAIQTLCVTYIELVRGVPLISILFMAAFMFPLFMPAGTQIDVIVRVLVGMTLFIAAYLAEVVRGGLQAVDKGQVEAAQSLGLSYWQTTRKIVLPQALRVSVPAIMNTFIGAFKDTSLVTIVSLYDLTGSLQIALGDADWRKFFLEGQFFVAAIYFVCCFAMSRYSLWIERHLDVGASRR